MNILHINTLQTAGAALCAMRINNALVEEGVNSRMLFKEGYVLPEGIEGAIAEEDKDFWHSSPLLLKMKYLLARTPLWRKMDKEKVEMILRRKNNQLERNLYLHGPFTSYKNIVRHPLVEWADIIHLHWVAYFVDYPTFFQEVRKPIVWTLHDKFPATGVLHFESKFYPVPDNLRSIDTYCRKVKRESLLKAKKLNIVAISGTMAEECETSDVLQGFPVTLIHNGVDTDVFHPYNKQEVRKELGLPDNSRILLFSANSIEDENKGFDRLVQALQSMEVSNMALVCIGLHNPTKPLPNTAFPIIYTGYINEQAVIAKYYSAADLFLQCSYIESFGQTIVEAMACGTPVVTTPCGVAPEVIHPFNGVLCNGFAAEALAMGMGQAFTVNYESTAIRHYIVENYQYNKIAQQYLKLYESIMS